MIVTDNFNDIYKELIKTVMTGNESSPRGMPVRELLGVQFTLTNPRRSLCTIRGRKLNYKFAIIEKMEYASGVSNPKVLCHYNKNMSHFTNERGEFDGAYGPRIDRQLEYVYDLLKRDPDTRQAVININNESDKRETRDVPCTLNLQFLLRNDKLNLIVTMRSNDLLWGTPYDVNGFCFLQELMATWLGVDLGHYIHFAGSLHIYQDRIEELQKLIDDRQEVDEESPRIQQFDFKDRRVVFDTFWHVQRQIQEENIKSPESLLKGLDLEYSLTQFAVPTFIKKYLARLL